jgi:nucleotide sugar dehydrogenase
MHNNSIPRLDNSSRQIVVIIGLGYVGLTLAAHLLESGCKVFGVEIRDEILQALKNGDSPFHEPGLKEIIRNGIENELFFVTAEVPFLSERCTFIITVGTPLGKNFLPDMTPISRVANQVKEKIKDGDLVILRSTVQLGTTEEIVLPILQESGNDFFLSFCPERTIEGKALEELKYLPQIVGGISDESTEAACSFFKRYTEEVVSVSSAETAEMIKLVDNMQRDAQFAIANEVAVISTIRGVRAREVIQMGKIRYPRTNLPMPGPVGGPCLEKDSWILANSLPKNLAKNSLALAARNLNLGVVEFGIDAIQDFVRTRSIAKPRISVLGLAFKGIPETDDLRGAPSIRFIHSLLDRFPEAVIEVWDPVITAYDLVDERITFGEGLYESCAEADAVVLMNNHPIFDDMNLNELGIRTKQNCLLYDFWDRFEKDTFREGLVYRAWGFNG